jgi:hypothetical protein
MLGALLAGCNTAPEVWPVSAPITLTDVRQYRFGTILNGGNSGP